MIKKERVCNHHGYVHIYCPEHPKSRDGRVKRSWLIAEKAFKKQLPFSAVVHHINGTRTDDKNKNLVVCESRGYHNILHEREIALKACGNASWRKCWICGEYDNLDNFYIKKNGSGEHYNCRKEYLQEWKLKNGRGKRGVNYRQKSC